jgi:hypothetical protein
MLPVAPLSWSSPVHRPADDTSSDSPSANLVRRAPDSTEVKLYKKELLGLFQQCNDSDFLRGTTAVDDICIDLRGVRQVAVEQSYIDCLFTVYHGSSTCDADAPLVTKEEIDIDEGSGFQCVQVGLLRAVSGKWQC